MPNHDYKPDASNDTPQINRGADWLLQDGRLGQQPFRCSAELAHFLHQSQVTLR
jgi:hypothetical protein